MSNPENGKSYLLKITPQNSGENQAKDVRLEIIAQSSEVKIDRFDNLIGSLDASESGPTVTIPFKLDRAYKDSTVEFSEKN